MCVYIYWELSVCHKSDYFSLSWAPQARSEAWEVYQLKLYRPDDPSRPCRPKAGQGLVMMMMMIWWWWWWLRIMMIDNYNDDSIEKKEPRQYVWYIWPHHTECLLSVCIGSFVFVFVSMCDEIMRFQCLCVIIVCVWVFQFSSSFIFSIQVFFIHLLHPGVLH